MITNPTPAWMDSDLQQLADTANKFFDRECLPNDARWRELGRAMEPQARYHVEAIAAAIAAKK